MLGTIVNTIAVLIGGCIGLLLKKGLPQRLADILMKALGLCTLFIGITGVMGGKRTLLVILSMVLGTLLGVFFLYMVSNGMTQFGIDSSAVGTSSPQ